MFNKFAPVGRRFAALSRQSCNQHIVVALGGNALLQRGQAMTMDNQQANIAEAVKSLRNVLGNNAITFVHGNGPQVGMLLLQDVDFHKKDESEPTHLDVLDAETEGMIGYLLEQEVDNMLPRRGTVTILSQIVVDGNDPAFQNPTKFTGPQYSAEEVRALQLTPQPDGVYWKRSEDEYYKDDGKYLRRVVPSPLPVELLELEAVRLLTEKNFIVICAGGGGIPVLRDETGHLRGVEAVIDKDRAATMLGLALGANGLMILTDVPGVAVDFGFPAERWIKSISPDKLMEISDGFPDGSMGPKVSSAIEFTKGGGWCTIGSLKAADQMMEHKAGTLVTNEHGPNHIDFH